MGLAPAQLRHLCTELWHERENCSVKTRNGSLGNLRQQGFEVAVRQLDRVEGGAVRRQVEQGGTACFDSFADAGERLSVKWNRCCACHFSGLIPRDACPCEGGE